MGRPSKYPPEFSREAVELVKTPAETERALVLLSGGMDSTVSLWWALQQGLKVEALTVDYGQPARAELRAAKQVASAAGVRHGVISVSGRHYAPAAMGDGAEGSGAFIRGRNLMLLSVAASTLGSTSAAIVVGVVGSDPYPDCQPEYLETVEPLLAGIDGASLVRIWAPLLACQDKRAVVALGNTLGVPWALTWSCDRRGRSQCGRCASCTSRRTAFSTVTSNGSIGFGALEPGGGTKVGLDDEIAARQQSAHAAARIARAWDRSPGNRDDPSPKPASGHWAALVKEILESSRVGTITRTGYLYEGPDGSTRFTYYVGSRWRRLRCTRVRYIQVMDPSGKDHTSEFGLTFLSDGRLLKAYGSPSKVRGKAIELMMR